MEYFRAQTSVYKSNRASVQLGTEIAQPAHARSHEDDRSARPLTTSDATHPCINRQAAAARVDTLTSHIHYSDDTLADICACCCCLLAEAHSRTPHTHCVDFRFNLTVNGPRTSTMTSGEQTTTDLCACCSSVLLRQRRRQRWPANAVVRNARMSRRCSRCRTGLQRARH